MTDDMDPWMGLAGQLDEAAKPRGAVQQTTAPRGQGRAAIVAGIAQGLQLMAPAIRQSMMNEEAAPKRADLRERLEKARDHARGLLELVDVPDEFGKASVKPDLDAWMLVGQLQDALGGYTFDENGPGPLQGLARILHEVYSRAEAALQTIPEGRKGANRHFVRPDGLSAEELCALVICEAWTLLNPARPAGSNPKAKSLLMAAAYWRLCELPTERSDPASWSGNFHRVLELSKEAQAADKDKISPLTMLRQTIRGVLAEGEAFWKADPKEDAAFASLLEALNKVEN